MVPDYVQFKSLLPLLEEQPQDHYKAIYGGYRDHQRMIRQDQYKLIHYPKAQKSLLFNLEKDPFELNDISDQEDGTLIVERMINGLIILQDEVGDTLQINQ